MKLRNIVWVGMLFLSLLTYAQKPVYSFSDKGDIVTNSSYIKPFDTCTFKGVTPYIMKFENMLKTLSGQTYEIRCYKYNNWENDPGDFHVIEVRYNNNVVLTLENPEGWDFFSQDFVSSIMSYLCYGKVDLDENTIVLLFTGTNIMSQPPYCTLIVLKEGKASLIYNQQAFINDIQKNNILTRIVLQRNTVEWLNEKTQSNKPEYDSLILKSSMVYSVK